MMDKLREKHEIRNRFPSLTATRFYQKSRARRGTPRLLGEIVWSGLDGERPWSHPLRRSVCYSKDRSWADPLYDRPSSLKEFLKRRIRVLRFLRLRQDNFPDGKLLRRHIWQYMEDAISVLRYQKVARLGVFSFRCRGHQNALHEGKVAYKCVNCGWYFCKTFLADLGSKKFPPSHHGEIDQNTQQPCGPMITDQVLYWEVKRNNRVTPEKAESLVVGYLLATKRLKRRCPRLEGEGDVLPPDLHKDILACFGTVERFHQAVKAAKPTRMYFMPYYRVIEKYMTTKKKFDVYLAPQRYP